MNAGCYGSYIKDYFVSAKVVTRSGELIELSSKDIQFSYRYCDLPEDHIILEATFCAQAGNPQILHAKMKDQLEKEMQLSQQRNKLLEVLFETQQVSQVQVRKMRNMISRLGN